jgi:hypothetical protein
MFFILFLILVFISDEPFQRQPVTAYRGGVHPLNGLFYDATMQDFFSCNLLICLLHIA